MRCSYLLTKQKKRKNAKMKNSQQINKEMRRDKMTWSVCVCVCLCIENKRNCKRYRGGAKRAHAIAAYRQEQKLTFNTHKHEMKNKNCFNEKQRDKVLNTHISPLLLYTAHFMVVIHIYSLAK